MLLLEKGPQQKGLLVLVVLWVASVSLLFLQGIQKESRRHPSVRCCQLAAAPLYLGC